MQDDSLKPVLIDYVDLENVQKPEIVYKYRSFNKGDIYHDNILYNNHIYMSAPSDFEDQFDCKNPTRYDILNEEETKEWISRKVREQHPKYNDRAVDNLVSELQARNKFKDEKWMAEFDEYEWKSYNDLTGIFSVSENSLSEEMWVKYGDNHKGVCYGFNTNTLIKSCGLGGGGNVIYVPELPLIHPFDPIMVQATNRVFYKTDDWAFEQEYRLRTFTRAGRIRIYSDEVLKSVILGKDFDLSQLPIIIEQLVLKGRHAKLSKVILIGGEHTVEEIPY